MKKYMLENLFKMLDEHRNTVTDYVDGEFIAQKQMDLGVKCPQSMVEFYTHFGNDTEVLSAFYLFDKVEDIKIEYDAIVFGEKHEGMGRLGIKNEDLNAKYPTVCWYSYDMKEWYVEEGVSFVFFFGIACWQVLNAMPTIARVRLAKDEFEKLVGKELKYLSDEKIFILGDVIPVLGKDVLGCYLSSNEELYLGTTKDDVVLEDYEKRLGLDLDWL